MKVMNENTQTATHSFPPSFCKGQLISKANCQALNSFKKQMYEFVFTTMQRVFVCFLGEIEDTQKKTY